MDNQLGFYWINGDQLVTVKNSKVPGFKSNDECLVQIYGMMIRYNRDEEDFSFVNNLRWSGILVGTDGYPEKNEWQRGYCITGGHKGGYFKATAIEFYGVKLQI